MKSFSSTVKEELCLANNEFDCCDKAEYMGLMLFGALINGSVIKFITGNIDVLNKYIKLGKSLGLKIDSKQSGSGAAARYICAAALHPSTFLFGRAPKAANRAARTNA